MNPIYTISTHDSAGKKMHAIDLRSLPEDVKINIIKAALGVVFHYKNGSYGVDEDTSGGALMDDLAKTTDAIEAFMHEVALVSGIQGAQQ